HGTPPLSEAALLSSANFTLSLLPARLSRRIQALRNLPFIVVSNPHISQIYDNYLHSLSILEPYTSTPITTLATETTFTDMLSDLVQTHANTIPTLARGFLECRRYISPASVTAFLDRHLRARIGTRLIAEQHIALHLASQPPKPSSTASRRPTPSEPETYIGAIDTALSPSAIVSSCGSFVSELCELKYGVRPGLVVNGQRDARFAYVPVHLEYILTELLKNAFRATVESGREKDAPVEVTIATSAGEAGELEGEQGISIRIRDRGNGISAQHLPNIWAYSFTTFSEDDEVDALDTISAAGVGGGSTIAGLGYGLPLSRAYAEYFGGTVKVQSMWGWGTDVYVMLKGVGRGKGKHGGEVGGEA
ncbi:MAG: hypothetical protein M1814_006935, partial [Vezdaea aestivalis]